MAGVENGQVTSAPAKLPYHFSSGKELLALCDEHHVSIAQLMFQNELTWRSETEVVTGLDQIWAVMQARVARGCRTEGHLPGPLKVKRRASALYKKLSAEEQREGGRSLADMDWLNLFPLVVNEEKVVVGS
ncbi:L-serine ammonia-lyase, iron-sulfur-dependent, subunit beta [Paraburkholderia mimosarum]|uniref:L-serine ammonia-lyase, iron-sulfur-dependent, subunit beta n=1 Tax=Paraburkholderia mimosarum TaxID=312026 RepID=UPI0039C0F191